MAPDKRETPLYTAFRETFEKQKDPLEKIKLGIQFMKLVLSKIEGVTMKDFWDAKNLVSPAFREQMNTIQRNHLWMQYAELTDEARKLREIMDEQIELAITALEADMEKYDALIAKRPKLDFPKKTASLLSNEESYIRIQQELDFLKTLIARLDALRKEVLDTDMRISPKNRILKRLSKLGDSVFPKRKELIVKVSEQFTADIEKFSKGRFVEEKVPYYALREEIMNLQKVAKMLTLNSQTFTKTRKILSACWDVIKEKDKERKQELGEKSKEHQENFVKISEMIKPFREFAENEENLDKEKINSESQKISDCMRDVDLSRDGVRKLRDEIQEIRKTALDKIEEKSTRKERAGLKKIEDFNEKLSKVIENESKTPLEKLEEEASALGVEYASFDLHPSDEHRIERQLLDLKSFVLDKKEERGSSKTDFEALFDERHALYDEVKSQIKLYRKELGGSGLDFEKGMAYRDLYDSARIHLDREAALLEKLEEKIDHLES